MAEAAYYEVLEETLPILLIVEEGKIKKKWIGESPNIKDIIKGLENGG